MNTGALYYKDLDQRRTCCEWKTGAKIIQIFVTTKYFTKKILLYTMYIKRHKVADFRHKDYYFKIVQDKETNEYIYERYEYRHQFAGGKRDGYWQKVIEDRYKDYTEASERMARQIYTLVHDSYM